MSRPLIAYLATLVAFGAADLLWIVLVAKNFYKKVIGHLMAEKPNVVAGAVFYLLYGVGLTYFGVWPHLATGDWQSAAIDGGLFGLFCTATYDLTNLATLRGWPASMTVMDIVWGVIASAFAATVAVFVVRALS